MRPLASLALLMLLAAPALAQQLPALQPQSLRTPHTHSDGTFHPFCATDIESDKAKADLDAFHAARAAGLLPRAGKTNAMPPEIGDLAMFNVLDGPNISDGNWAAKEFTLKDKSDFYYLWVRTTELDNGNVTEAEITSVREALLVSTPAQSYNPGAGIITNNELIFGPPPDYDGDGITDILLYDIEAENTGPAQTLGFVSTADLSPNAPDGIGNQADVLYLDAKQGTADLDDLAWVAAHEFTHLIHFGNTNVQFGTTLLFEAFAEYAMVLNGYFTRSTSYLADPSEYNFDLFGWRGDERDYQRGGLFATYIATQIGYEAAGSMVSEGVLNADGMDTILQANGTSLEQIVADFHIANYLNDFDFDSHYGYDIDGRAGARALETIAVDGNKGSVTNPTERTVGSGAVQYLVWENVANFELFLDVVTIPQLEEIVRARLDIPVLLEHTDGLMEIQMVQPQSGSTTFNGTYDRITLVVAHTRPDQVATPFNYSAAWSASEPGVVFEEVVYDDGMIVVSDGSVEAFNLGDPQARFANRYTVPTDAILDAVKVSPFYDHDFSGTQEPPTAARDFRLHVWAVTTLDNGTQLPGDELFAIDVTDSRSNSTAPELSFHTVDLGAFEADLTGLPEQIYIGLSNAGTDGNLLFMGVSQYAGDDVSALYLSDAFGNSWAPFGNICVGGCSQDEDFLLRNRTLPIRATFKTSTGIVANEDEGALPEQITLAQNYPNPFNPTTSIRYTLPQAMPVTLQVFDVLGRAVATLVDGLQAAGDHTVGFDAAGLSNGLYIYRLVTASTTQSRTMVLLK